MHVKVTPTDDRPARWLHEDELRECILQDGGTQIRLLTGEREFVREPPEEILMQLAGSSIADPLLLNWNHPGLPKAVIYDAQGIRHKQVIQLHLGTGHIWIRDEETHQIKSYTAPTPFTIHFGSPEAVSDIRS